MGPNQDMASQPSMQPTPTQPIQPTEQPAQGGNDIVFQDKPKKNTGMVLGVILLLLIAAGGVGFGVWAMMDGNQQKEQLNSQISTLKEQNNELQEKLDEAINNNEEASEETSFWPASPIHSDNKIYMINDSDEVVATLEVSMVIQSIIGCGQAISEDDADGIISCTGVSNTGQEFGFSYNTDDGTLELSLGE